MPLAKQTEARVNEIISNLKVGYMEKKCPHPLFVENSNATMFGEYKRDTFQKTKN